jgi:hypothetical protein
MPDSGSSMMLTVTRQTYTPSSTIGVLDIDGLFECYTEEPPKPQGDNPQKPYCIPAGTYKGKKYNSPSLGRTVLLLIGVPGFDFIEIHNGNYPRNTHGCTLVGQTCGDDFVGASNAALDALIAKLPDDFEITYK